MTALPSASGRPRSSRMTSGRSASQRRSAAAGRPRPRRPGTRGRRGCARPRSRVGVVVLDEQDVGAGVRHRSTGSSGATGARRRASGLDRPGRRADRWRRDGPAHRLDQPLDDRQADAQAASSARRRARRHALELVEDERQVGVGDAGAAILDSRWTTSPGSVARDRIATGASRRRVVGDVVEDVRQDRRRRGRRRPGPAGASRATST